MNDRGLAKGIMLKHRGKIECTDCHFGKQRRKTFWNALDRMIKQDNEVIFADLLFPGVHNGSPYSAVLVIMDGYSHYVRMYLLKSKTEGEVNGHMTDYINWAERQHDPDSRHLVRQVLTDKGQ